MAPRLSVVVLTLNEARNIGNALRALARQTVASDLEVIVVDAASTDATVPLIEAERPNLPMPLRLVVAQTRLPIGEARNRGAGLASAPLIAFASADAQLDPQWAEEALRSLESADLVFGKQLHTPHEWSVGASVRGTRYHFPDGVPDDPLPYASNVAAAYKREVVDAFPFDPWANAAEDLLMAQRARDAGFRIAYNPRMVVRHHDVATMRQEWRKSVREGYGWAQYAAEIGHLRGLFVWALLLAAGVALCVVLPWLGAPALLGALYLPAVRRAWRRRHAMPRRGLVKGTLASPVFDLAFLVQYARGLLARRKSAPQPLSQGGPNPKETQA